MVEQKKAGRPKANTPANKLIAQRGKKATASDIYCSNCGEFKKKTDFYQSSSCLNNHFGLMTVCKDCITSMYDGLFKANGSQRKSTYLMCAELNIPYMEIYCQASMDGKAHTFRSYVTKVNSLPQNKGKAFIDSDKFSPDKLESDSEENTEIDEDSVPDLRTKWGSGYEIDVLLRFEEKYNFLKNNYKEKTNMHIEALSRYVRYSVLEEVATEDGDLQKAKGWGAMAKDAAAAAKINPSQLTKADLSDGLSTIGELVQAIEREVDIVPILPKFKYRPNDALDFNIWCYVNYERHLRGMPLVEYADVYKFYDERVDDYVKQYGDPYGMFTNDTTKKNRPNIEVFLQDDELEELMANEKNEGEDD